MSEWLACNDCAHTCVCGRKPYMTEDDDYCAYWMPKDTADRLQAFGMLQKELPDLLDNLYGQALWSPHIGVCFEEQMRDEIDNVMEWLT